MNKASSSSSSSGQQAQLMNGGWRSIVLVTALVGLAATGALAPTWVAAQAVVAPSAAPAGQTAAQDLGNPVRSNPRNRNPDRRSGVSDSAPVAQDPRNSTSRPTLPAAPDTPDSRDAVLPAPDNTRDAAPG